MDWHVSGKSRRWLRERMLATDDANECRRCSALLRLSEGDSVSSVSREFGVSRQTVHNWRNRFRDESVEGLKDHPREGRPTIWTKERVELLKTLLDETPRQHEFQATGWTAGLLQTRLRQLLDWDVSEDSLRRKLHQLNYVWKRFRYRLTPDPDRAKKKTYPQTCHSLATRHRSPF